MVYKVRVLESRETRAFVDHEPVKAMRFKFVVEQDNVVTDDLMDYISEELNEWLLSSRLLREIVRACLRTVNIPRIVAKGLSDTAISVERRGDVIEAVFEADVVDSQYALRELIDDVVREDVYPKILDCVIDRLKRVIREAKTQPS